MNSVTLVEVLVRVVLNCSPNFALELNPYSDLFHRSKPPQALSFFTHSKMMYTQWYKTWYNLIRIILKTQKVERGNIDSNYTVEHIHKVTANSFHGYLYRAFYRGSFDYAISVADNFFLISSRKGVTPPSITNFQDLAYAQRTKSELVCPTH